MMELAEVTYKLNIGSLRQAIELQERFEIQSEVTFTEVLAYLIMCLNPGIEIP